MQQGRLGRRPHTGVCDSRLLCKSTQTLSPLHQIFGQAEANVNPRHVIMQPLEDLGNALVSLFPVEMQYNIRGSCR